MTLTFRLTQQEDAPYLTKWLTDSKILRWFPMMDAREIEDAVRIWIGYCKIGAGITVLYDGKPCGMATLYIQPYVKQKHTCLFSIILQEEMRGKGVGTALMKELISFAKEKFHIEILHLEVYEGNPAQYLYEKMGFVVFGRQSHFIKEDGRFNAKILMQKRL